MRRSPLALSLAAPVVLLAGNAAQEKPKQPDPRIAQGLAMADRTARWLEAQAIVKGEIVDWVVDVDAARQRRSPGLYAGTPGVILFYLEHHHATGRKKSLQMAQRAADGLWSRASKSLTRHQKGLYSGIAGLAYTFAELHRTTGEKRELERARTCVRALHDSIRDDGSWSPTTDIIGGTAGIGLTLLRLDADFKIPKAKDLAVRAGDNLLKLAKVDGKQRSWKMLPNYQKVMPNFSHGTAGIAYFLLQLHEATGAKRFLDGARGGAEHLLALTRDDGLIQHNQVDEDLCYLGWCHGPAGTSRLFDELARVTGDSRFTKWTERAADTLAALGIPEKQTKGFWKNHGQCCGTAGVVDFYLHRRARTRDAKAAKKFDAKIDAMLDAIAGAAKRTEDGTACWTVAEHRVLPDRLSTQTGYMQGAAGIGLLFLHDAARRAGKPRRIVLPDSPYPRKKLR